MSLSEGNCRVELNRQNLSLCDQLKENQGPETKYILI